MVLEIDLKKDFFIINKYISYIVCRWDIYWSWHQAIETDSTFLKEGIEKGMPKVKEKYAPVGFVVGYPIEGHEKDIIKHFSQAYIKGFEIRYISKF